MGFGLKAEGGTYFKVHHLHGAVRGPGYSAIFHLELQRKLRHQSEALDYHFLPE
jgi:hypothetical protein